LVPPSVRSQPSAGAAEVLRSVGLLVTQPRLVVYRAIAAGERPLGAVEVYDLVRARHPRIGLTTIYRVLRDFAGAGLLHAFGRHEQRYLMCGAAPHVHLVCERCGRVIIRSVDDARRWWQRADIDVDFDVDVERSDVHGTCADCRSRPLTQSPQRRNC
jgi:Fur family ferric uptake transcriptional regulator